MYNRSGQPLRLSFVVGPKPPLPPPLIVDLVMCKPDDAAFVWLVDGSSKPTSFDVSKRLVRDLWQTIGSPALGGYETARLLTAGAWQSVANHLGNGRYRLDISLVISTNHTPNM